MSSPMDFILDKAKDLAKDGLIDAGMDYGQELIDEHQALGPQALQHVEKELNEIDKETSKYITAYMVAQVEVRRGVVNEINYHSTCVRIFSRSEMERIDEIVKILGNLTQRSTELEKGVEQRIKANIEQIERGFKARQGKGALGQDEVIRIHHEITRLKESSYQTGSDSERLQARCAEIIGKLNVIRFRMVFDPLTLHFSMKCHRWLSTAQKAEGVR
ncbi:MAG: hypothetical protein HY308_00100 [Gammaproteobacteria bacterium]|nr:hypothetical protein [Gammaproteobacteria bacterium]